MAEKLYHNDRPIPVHPGRILKRYLEQTGMSQKHFAEHIGISYVYLSDIINCRKGVSARIAYKLEAALGVSASVWINLQAQWDLSQVNRLDVVSGIKKIKLAA